MHWLGGLIACSVVLAAPSQDGAPPRQSMVGMPARIDQLVISGPELEARPIADRKSPLVVRVVATYKHGESFRYDLEYYGLEPGRFDLRDYLRPKDGAGAASAPSLPVEIVSTLPPGQSVPADLSVRPMPRLGGYRALLAAVGAVWLIGLIALLYGRRRRRAAIIAAAAPISLVDQLRPLVASAIQGNLSGAQQAELERLLLGYWRRRLGLEDSEPAAAIAHLRRHERAGELLRQVEAWLHQPGGAQRVDIAAVLEPYRELPAGDLSPSVSATAGTTPNGVLP